jgi:hypothetical protein
MAGLMSDKAMQAKAGRTWDEWGDVLGADEVDPMRAYWAAAMQGLAALMQP